MNYIKVKGLSKSYSDINALKNLSMEIEAGRLFGILAVSYTHLTLPTMMSV